MANKRNQYSTDSAIADEVKRLVGEGWTYERRGPHGKMIDPRGRFAFPVPVTPSGARSRQNFLADVRRYERTTKEA